MTESEYEQRLAGRCRAWIAKHEEEAARLRTGVCTRSGLYREPYPGTLMAQFVEWQMFEEIRKAQNWPTFLAWKKTG